MYESDNQPAPDRQKQKKLYVKPEVERVRLVPEEAVLTACKNPGTGGCPVPPLPGSRLPGS